MTSTAMSAPDEHAEHESAWASHFSPEQREQQQQVDRDAWNGIIGILLAIVCMGVTMGAGVVLAITYLT